MDPFPAVVGGAGKASVMNLCSVLRAAEPRSAPASAEAQPCWDWDREGACTEQGWSLQSLVISGHGISGCQAGLESRGAWEGVKCVLSSKKLGGGGRCWL